MQQRTNSSLLATHRKSSARLALSACASLAMASLMPAIASAAGTTWDGGAGADTSWGTNTNWDTDTLPAFDGTDSLTVTAPSGANTALTLGADRSISRITFGGGATPISLSGNTLTLASTTTAASTGNALWNANTADNKTATVNSNILLQSGSAGTYTGYIRENSNSSGGTRFNGAITQGAGENWTLNFSQNSARGNFFLSNASNSISAIVVENTNLTAEISGSFGGGSLTLKGGTVGTAVSDYYTAPVTNSITLINNAGWVSQVQTRLTGALAQSSKTLTYGNNSTPTFNTLTRLEYSSIAGTGSTVLAGGSVATATMSNFTSGTLNLGSSGGGWATLVLGGAAGDVPTWSDFSAARTYSAAGGTGTWRIDAGNTGANNARFGGFAARGADLVIPASGSGLSNTTFTSNFVLGSVATLDGVRYANNAVNIQSDIAYGAVAGANRFFMAAPNEGTSKTATQLVLTGPVHELSGQLTGDNVVIYPMSQASSQQGIIRISNATNNLTGTSRWVLGGTRSTFTTLGGGSIANPANMGDYSSIVLVFTSDGAFGGATEVNVASQGSSGTRTSGTMLFEDTNGAGSTTFTRNFNLQENTIDLSPAWGSYGGDVIYTGTATMGGIATGAIQSIIHVQAGAMNLGVTAGAAATITNNMTGATTFNKSGNGTLDIRNLTLGGTQTSNSWEVRAGTLLVNQALATGTVTVESGGTLGGRGTINGLTTIKSGGTLAPGNSPGVISITGNLVLNSGSTTAIQITGTTRDTDYDGVNISASTTYGGALAIAISGSLSTYTYDLFNLTNAPTGNFSSVDLTGAMAGSLTYDTGVWSGTFSGNSVTFTNSSGDLYINVIPEPTALGLVGLAGFGLLAGRRRRAERV